MNISVDRWRKAQDAEAKVTAELIREARLQSAPRFMKYLDRMRSCFVIKPSDRILDIGCKYYGLISFIKQGVRCCLDPLLATLPSPSFAETSSNFNSIVAVGENIPLKDESFDIVVSTNTLDHVYHPQAVVSEVSRVLNKGGWLVLSLHTFGTMNKLIRSIRNIIGLGDRLHPHNLSRGDVLRILSTSGFRVELFESFDVANDKGLFSWLRFLYGVTLGRIDRLIEGSSTNHSNDSLFICKKQE